MAGCMFSSGFESNAIADTRACLTSTMTRCKSWQKIESQVYRPARWLLFSLGLVFFVTGVIGFVTIGGNAPANMLWIPKLGAALFALAGAAALASAVASFVPVDVRHAAADVLREVPSEPVIWEGTVVHQRLKHELVKVVDAWHFRPATSLWRSDLRVMIGFAVTFMAVFAGIASWVAHEDMHIDGWPLAILCGTLATAVFAGSGFLIVIMVMRAGFQQLCRLSIPLNGGDLEFDSAKHPAPHADLLSGLKSVFQTDSKRHCLTIPRELVSAVQLCPWRYVFNGPDGNETIWAVQGLLVLSAVDNATYYRLPFLLTGDVVGAARLMQRLATTLHVPYLYCADAKGWKAEEARARARQPLRGGGMQT